MYAVMGFFLYPALSAGVLSRESVASGWELPFGGVLLGIGLLGLFTTDKKRFTGFFLCTVGAALSFAAAQPVLRLLPYAALRSPFWYLLFASVIGLITLLSWQRFLAVCAIGSPYYAGNPAALGNGKWRGCAFRGADACRGLFSAGGGCNDWQQNSAFGCF